MSDEAEADVPTTVPFVQIPMDEFMKWFDSPGLRPDRIWIARDGDDIVGISQLSYSPVRGVVATDWTGMARKAPHPHAAVLFMDFLLSDAQQILAKRDFIPTNIKVKPLPAGLTLKFVDPAKLLDENDKWEKLYKDIITSQGR